METRLKNDEPAPDFLLRDLDGHPHTLSHYRGRITLLNFWSAECKWSKNADDALRGLTADWGPGVNWISIAPNANESLDLLRETAGQRGLPLVLHDPERKVTELYGAEMTPHFFVLDENGLLRYQGALDDTNFRRRTPTRHHLQEAVEALLAGEAPPEGVTPAYGCTIVYYDQG